MKKILVFLVAIFLTTLVKAQLPNQIGTGNTTTEAYDKGVRGADIGFRFRLSFGDTTAASAFCGGCLKNAAGQEVRVVNDIWMRSNDLQSWIKQTGTAGGSGTVTSVGLTITTPASPAFSVSNTPITTSGNIALNVLGTTGQYIRGDGSLATTPVLTNEWHLTGNAGTSPGTNFLGTTDNKMLMFKVNGDTAGYITPEAAGTFNTAFGVDALVSDDQFDGIQNNAFGYQALYYNTTGANNNALGAQSLFWNINGQDNVAIGTASQFWQSSGSLNTSVGTQSLLYDSLSNNNTAIGGYSLYNTTGSANTAIGEHSGYYNVAGSNQIFINSIDRSNFLGDTTASPFYVQQNATVANQRIKLNGQIITPYLTNYSAQDRLVGQYSSNSALGYITVAGSLSLSGGVLTGTGITGIAVGTTPIGFGTVHAVIFQGAGNVVQEDFSNFMYDDVNNRLGLGNSAPSQLLSVGSSSQFTVNTTGNVVMNGSVIGSASMDIFNTVTTTGNLLGAATTLTIGGTPTTAITHNYSTNATAAATTKTVNLGTGGAASSTTNINIGSTNGGTTTVNSPSLAIATAATIGGVAVPTISSTNTFTNKRWTARVGSTTSSATPTINTDNVDIYKITAQSTAITSMSSSLSGSPNDGDILEIQFTDDGTPRTISWGSSFASSSVTLPATTATSTTLTVILQYYTTSSYGNNKWTCTNYY